MWVVPITTFFVALLGVIILFARKWLVMRRPLAWEDPSEVEMTRADDYALAAKAHLSRLSAWAQTLPGVLWLIIRYGIHRSAKAFARLARAAEDAAHRLADRASHRHRFERGNHTSEYLRQVGETKEQLREHVPPEFRQE
jgi:hypothetical protein